MICSILFTLLLSFLPISAQTGGVANIVMLRGKDVSVYSGGKKVVVESKLLPFQLSPGDEVQLGVDSDCELVFSNSDSMYAGAETLFSVDWYRNSMNYIWIKYGTLLYRGENPAALKASDLSVTSKSGDFLVRYKRSSSEATILNFGGDMSVKQGDDEFPYVLMTNRYVKVTSFKNQNKMYGFVDPKKIPLFYDTFRITFTPNEKAEGVEPLGSDSNKAGKEVVPANKKANIDYMKRTIGI